MVCLDIYVCSFEGSSWQPQVDAVSQSEVMISSLSSLPSLSAWTCSDFPLTFQRKNFPLMDWSPLHPPFKNLPSAGVRLSLV